MMTGTAWPAAPWTAASPCASWCPPRPQCSACCGATPAVSPTSPGLSPTTSSCPPHSTLPCASGPLRTAAASGRFLIRTAPNCSAAPSSRSTTTLQWSGFRGPLTKGGAAGPGELSRGVSMGVGGGGSPPVPHHSCPCGRTQREIGQNRAAVLDIGLACCDRHQGGPVRSQSPGSGTPPVPSIAGPLFSSHGGHWLGGRMASRKTGLLPVAQLHCGLTPGLRVRGQGKEVKI